MTIAVALITYNSASDVVACLGTIAGEAAEIVVVDNASSDGTPDVVRGSFPRARVIVNTRNLGFAAGANQAIRATSTDIVFLVNPDSTVRPGSLAALERCLLEHPRAAAAGALILNTDGSVQPTKRAFPTLWQSFLHATVGTFWPNNPGTRAYVLADASFDEPRPVDWVASTAVALRRSAFDAIGGYDESFFFFVEDVDLCKRLRDAGWEIWFEPGAVVTHVWGGSWTRRPLRFMALHQLNLFRYARKHRRGAWVLAYPFIGLGLTARFMLLALRWLITRRSVPAHRDIERGRTG
jgi:GT2 family glycosyltransferase